MGKAEFFAALSSAQWRVFTNYCLVQILPSLLTTIQTYLINLILLNEGLCISQILGCVIRFCMMHFWFLLVILNTLAETKLAETELEGTMLAETTLGETMLAETMSSATTLTETTLTPVVEESNKLDGLFIYYTQT